MAEIEKAGKKLDLLQQNNILIDSELEEEPKEPRYDRHQIKLLYCHCTILLIVLYITELIAVLLSLFPGISCKSLVIRYLIETLSSLKSYKDVEQQDLVLVISLHYGEH